MLVVGVFLGFVLTKGCIVDLHVFLTCFSYFATCQLTFRNHCRPSNSPIENVITKKIDGSQRQHRLINSISMHL